MIDNLDVVLFLLAGALGGMVQAVIDKKGVISAPCWDRQARQLDLGVLADLLIGCTGALATLVVGIATLNALAGGAVPADARAGLFAAFPRWLLLASFGALVGFGSRKLLPALSDRINSMIEQEVAARTAGIERRVQEEVTELTEGQIGPMKDQQQALAWAIRSEAALVPNARGSAKHPLSELEGLVESYSAIEDPDYATRVRLKDEIYNKMTALIVRHNVPLKDILQRIEEGGGQGWILALAARLAAEPELGGGAELARVAAGAQWKHVMYRVASAFAHLAMANRLRRSEISEVEALFDQYLKAADDSLRRKIAATRKVIEARRSELP